MRGLEGKSASLSYEHLELGNLTVTASLLDVLPRVKLAGFESEFGHRWREANRNEVVLRLIIWRCGIVKLDRKEYAFRNIHCQTLSSLRTEIRPTYATSLVMV
jgi:hypothetical protein